MFFWKNWKKKKLAPPPIKPTPPVPPSPPPMEPLVPPTATARELETKYKKRWQAMDFRSEPYKALGGALARHPNISPSFLKEMIGFYPRKAAENPALPLILLENPDFFHTVYKPNLLDWLRDSATPDILIQGLLTHPDTAVAAAARYHVAIAGEAGADWYAQITTHFRGIRWKKKLEWFLAEQALQDRLPDWLRMQLAGSSTGEIRAIALNSPELRPLRELLIRASGIRDVSRLGPTASGYVSKAELAWLAEGPHWFRVLAARHPVTPPENLARLLTDSDGFIRIRVLRNPATPPEILRRHASSEIEAERIAVARNPACPADVLALLQSAPSDRLQPILAHRESAEQVCTSKKIKKEKRLPLSQTAPRRPVSSPFHDPNLTQSQLHELTNDYDRNVRRLAMRRGGRSKLKWSLRYQWDHQLQRLTLPEVLSLMTLQDYGEIRKATQAMSWEIRLTILANPLLTHDLTQELTRDGHQWIRAAARARLKVGVPLPLFGMIELP
ncbi:MAG: hypothetical protein QM758_24820 [Armatimonas sp.]